MLEALEQRWLLTSFAGIQSGSSALGFDNQATADPTAEIRGFTWHDRDSDGLWDEGEPALADWEIYLDLNNNGQVDEGEPKTATGADGSYAFTGLAAGTYTVAEIIQNGWEQTYPGTSGQVQPTRLGGSHASYTELSQELAAGLTTTGSTEPMYGTGSLPVHNDAIFQPQTAQSGSLINMHAFRADPRFAGIDGRGYSIVVLDSGLNLTHPFFGDRIVHYQVFTDEAPGAPDGHGHGSNVTSIAASQDATHTGVAPGVNIIHLKVLRDNNSGYFSWMEQALQWVIANAAAYNVAAVNMSIGDAGNYASPQSRYGIGDELAALAALEIIVSTSAGNDFFAVGSVPGVSYPAADPNTLGIGAVFDADIGPQSYLSGAQAFSTAADRVAPFSQRHPVLTEAFAPGAAITGASHIGSGISTFHGTSQASPHVAGATILAQQIAELHLGRRLSLNEFRVLLQATGVIVNDGDDEHDNVVNTGLNFARLDMLALGEAILAMAQTSFAHTVTVADGQVVEGINFGNRRLGELLVTTFHDVVDPNDGVLSLREAILQANGTSADITIVLDTGTYNLTKPGAGENGALTGDLDIAKGGLVTIVGLGPGQTVINANRMGDRVFEVLTGAVLNLEGLTVTGGGTANNGGGVLNAGQLQLLNTAVTGNSGYNGGGIRSVGQLTIAGSVISGNTGANTGGGLSNFGGQLMISGSTVSNNSAGFGGGLWTDAQATVVDSTFSGNQTTSNGAAIVQATGGTLLLTGSTLSGNIGNFGGGLLNSGTSVVIHSTFSGNEARNGGGGISSSGTLTVSHSTFFGNRADANGSGAGTGGGIRRGDGTITLHHTMAAGNLRGTGNVADDIAGPVQSVSSFNLVADASTSGGLTGGINGNIVGVDWLGVLDPDLADNGGPTLTHALRTGSPAIDAGDPLFDPAAFDPPLLYEQRGAGFRRVADGRIDIGAFEVQVAPTLGATLVGGTLSIVDLAPGGADNQLTVIRSGSELVITDAKEHFVAAPAGGVLSDNDRTLTIPLALVSAALAVDLAGGDDLLSVDFSGGDPIPAGGLSIDGGLGSDELALAGGAFHTSTFTYAGGGTGSIAFDADGAGGLAASTISYTGLEPIQHGVASDVVELIYIGGDETISVTDFGNGRTTVASTLGETTTFLNPAQRVEIVASGGTDLIHIDSLADGYPSLVIRGDDAADVVNFNGPLSFAAGHGLTVGDVGTVNLPNPASDIAASGTGAVSVTALRNIALASGSSITAVDGDIMLSANRQAAPLAGSFSGILLNAATISTSGAGDISLAGRGATGVEKDGVQIRSGAAVVGGPTGTVTIHGTGGGGSGSNYGVIIGDAGSRITSLGGDVLVIGQGGGDGSSSQNPGVVVTLGAEVTSGGDGDVSVQGTGGTGTMFNYGVWVTASNSRIWSGGGDVLVRGQGGDASGVRNPGVLVWNDGEITSGGNGNVTVQGTGGSGTSDNHGVHVSGSYSRIGSGGTGNVHISGQGGPGSADNNHGVELVEAAKLTSGGSGTVTVEGTGGRGSDGNSGIRIRAGGSMITSGGGNVRVVGQGGDGSGTDNHGILLQVAGEITSGAGGTVTVEGTGGKGTGGNHGVYVHGSVSQATLPSRITSSGGDIEVIGISGDGATSFGIQVEADGRIATTAGLSTVAVAADSMNLLSDASVVAAHRAVLRPGSPSTPIDVGGSDVLSGSPLTLGLDDAELDRIAARTLVIGEADSGPLTVSGAISRPASTDVELISGGAIVFDQSFDTGGGALRFSPGATGSVQPKAAGADAITAGNVTSFAPGSVLKIDLAGTSVDSQYDQLNVVGSVDLSGTSLELDGSYVSSTGDTFTIVSGQAVTGTFTNRIPGATIERNGRLLQIDYGTNFVRLTDVGPAVVATVVGRHVFYNNSHFDTADGAEDDDAIAPDKTALLPGQTAGFANYTSYSRGNNGIVVDIAGLKDTAGLGEDSFEFRVGNSNDPAAWALAPAPLDITVRPGAGSGGSDRVTIIWPDEAIRNGWLQVVVRVDAATGLAAPDVFYFGNAVGESGNSLGNAFVDGTDFAGARDNPRDFMNPAPIESRWDYNRDGNVDGSDLAIARDNATNFLTAIKLIVVPAGPSAPPPASTPAGEGEATIPAHERLEVTEAGVANWKTAALPSPSADERKSAEPAETPLGSPDPTAWTAELSDAGAQHTPARPVEQPSTASSLEESWEALCLIADPLEAILEDIADEVGRVRVLIG